MFSGSLKRDIGLMWVNTISSKNNNQNTYLFNRPSYKKLLVKISNCVKHMKVWLCLVEKPNQKPFQKPIQISGSGPLANCFAGAIISVSKSFYLCPIREKSDKLSLPFDVLYVKTSINML